MLHTFVSLTQGRLQCKGTTGRCKCLASILLALVFVTIMGLPVLAASPSAYSVRAVIPENQIDNRLTYFDLLVSPGDTQVLQVAITNSEEWEVEAHVALNPASTAQNGLIVYTDPDARDESLDLAVTDFATVLTPDLRIPAGGMAMAEIRLNVPEQPFEGVVLGGVSITADYVVEQPEDEQTEGIQIENRYAYVIGLKLQENLEAAPAAPDFHLQDIYPDLVNYRQALLVNLQQSEPFIANGLEVSAQVTKTGAPGFIRNLDLDNVQMAPNSNGDFVIDWESPIDPGTYRLYMRVEREDRVWEWDEEFVISGEAATQMNQESVMDYGPERGALPMWIIILVGVLLALVFLLLLIIFKRRKDDKKEKSTQTPSVRR